MVCTLGDKGVANTDTVVLIDDYLLPPTLSLNKLNTLHVDPAIPKEKFKADMADNSVWWKTTPEC